MAFELILSVNAQSGQEITLEHLRTITQKSNLDIDIEWSEPEKLLGISEHLYEILGTIGVLALPVSVFASVLANEISRIIYAIQDPAKSSSKITFTLVSQDSGKAMHIEFSSRDQVIVKTVAEKIRNFLI